MTDTITDPALRERFVFAQTLIGEAGDLALSYFNRREHLAITSKGHQDLVSEADVETERLIRSRIEARFADDGFLGEESGASEFRPGQGIWVVDPIDGTQPFVSGLSAWCVSIGYLLEGRVAFGLVNAPARGELFCGGAGFPATINGRPMARHPAQTIRGGLVEVGYNPRTDMKTFMRLLETFLQHGGMYTRGGSGALALCDVAAGRLAGFVEIFIKSWDCLGAIGVIEAAGLETTNFLAGDGLHSGNPLIAGNAAIVAELRGVCRACGIVIPS